MLALIDTRASKEISDSLSSLGFEVLKVPENKRLAPPVSAHPDMRLFALGKKIFISEEEQDELLPLTKRLTALGYEIVYSSVSLSKEYPRDIAFNCFAAGKYLFGNLPYLAPEISEEAKKQGYTLVSVKQGYAKCSTLIVDEGAIITADPSIYTASAGVGLDAFFINNPEGAIKLEGYSCGFIGGASGSCGDTVYFCGDISRHPSGEAIRDFCIKHNKAVLSLSKEPLCDIGSILFFN